MSQDNPRDFTCPQCESRYRLVRAKAGPGTSDQPVHCVVCGHALAPARRRIRSEVLPHRPIVMARKQRHRFRVALLEGTPAMFVGYLGYVEAADEKAAIEAAAKEYKIADALRDRLVARRDEL